jgi:VWFA-related protein
VSAAIFLSALLLTSPPTQRAPSFAASVESVYVDAFVTRDGKAVTGLTAADFEVLDEGVRQRLTLARLEDVPIAAVMVFDASGSVMGEKLDHLRAAGRALLAGLRPQDQAAVIAFSQELRVAAPPGSDRAAVGRALDALEGGGATAVWDALYAGLVLPTLQRRPMVVLFTDGQDNMSWLSPGQVLKVAEQSDALLHVVAILPPAEKVFTASGWETRDVEPDWLRSLRRTAEVTGGRIWPAGGRRRPGAHLPADPGGDAIAVRAQLRPGRCRPPRLAPPPGAIEATESERAEPEQVLRGSGAGAEPMSIRIRF